jgi:class 3 adenylate cyclase
MPEERILVTILFADVTGSTSLGESLDPEDVRTLMGRYYEHAREVIGSYGGTLGKFIGDAVMAVFGQPVAHGDDAERVLALCWSAWKTDSSCANFTRLRNCFSQSNPPARKVRISLRDCTFARCR